MSLQLSVFCLLWSERECNECSTYTTDVGVGILCPDPALTSSIWSAQLEVELATRLSHFPKLSSLLLPIHHWKNFLEAQYQWWILRSIATHQWNEISDEKKYNGCSLTKHKEIRFLEPQVWEIYTASLICRRWKKGCAIIRFLICLISSVPP